MPERRVCAGCGKPIGPRQGCSFNGREYRHAKERCDPDWRPIEDPNVIKINVDLEGRGRNGWFKVKTVDVWASSKEDTYVSVFSRQSYEEAPIVLKGSREDIMALLQGILRQLEPCTEAQEEAPYRRHLELERREGA